MRTRSPRSRYPYCFVEKLWRHGKLFGQVAGVALVMVGIVAIRYPWLLPGLHVSGMPAM
jgi:hypothetical protein